MGRSELRNRLRLAALLLLIVAGYYWKLTLTRQFSVAFYRHVAGIPTDLEPPAAR